MAAKEHLSLNLRLAALEVRAFAYLIGNQKNDEVRSLDLEELNWACGQILGRIGKRIEKMAKQIEDAELKLGHPIQEADSPTLYRSSKE